MGRFVRYGCQWVTLCDKCQWVALCDERQWVALCGQFMDAPGVPMCTVNTSSSGVATLTSNPISLKTLTANTCITVKFELQVRGPPLHHLMITTSPAGSHIATTS